MDKEMIKALEQDGEKLRQMTGEDHGPVFLGVDLSCSSDMSAEIEGKIGEDGKLTITNIRTGEQPMPEIEAHVSDNGEGTEVTIVVPPDLRQWQHFKISVDDARVLAAKLVRAANAAAANIKRE